MPIPEETHPFIDKWPKSDHIPQSAKSNWVIKYLEHGAISYFGYIPKDITYLIIGTFPAYDVVNGKRGTDYDYDFFYGSKKSNFWSYLSILFNCEIKTEANIFQLLDHQKIGITDILFRIKRTDSQHKSSSDDDLQECQKNDLARLLMDYPSIKSILFTSGTTLTIGKTAAGWTTPNLRTLLSKGKVNFKYITFQEKPFSRLITNLSINRNIEANFLYSPSDGAYQAISGLHNKAIERCLSTGIDFNKSILTFFGDQSTYFSIADKIKILLWLSVFKQAGIPIDTSKYTKHLEKLATLIWPAFKI